jgi:hypothetical protein
LPVPDAIATATAPIRTSAARAAITAEIARTSATTITCTATSLRQPLASARLPGTSPFPSGGPAKLFGCRPVSVRCSAAMLRIMLPTVAAAPERINPVAASDSVAAIHPVTAIYAIAAIYPIAIAVEIVVVVNIDVVVAPPSGTVPPAAAPHRSHR